MPPHNASEKGVGDGNDSLRKRGASMEPPEERPVKKTRKLTTSVQSPSSTSQDQAPVKLSRHRRYYLADGSLVLLVDNVLYNIHRYFFQKHSAHFATMFSLPSPKGQQAEGLTDDKPIHLTGSTTTQELDRLLSIFYPDEMATFEMKTIEDWTSVYSLALRWQFEGVAKIASKQLFDITTPIDRVVLGRQYPELKYWLKGALVDICMRKEVLGLEEGRRLSKDDVIRIASLRDKEAPVSRQRIARSVEQVFGLLPKRRTIITSLECDPSSSD